MDVCPDADKRSQFIAQAMERIIILPRSFGPRKIQDRNHLHLLWGWDKLSKGKDDGLLYCQMLLLFAVIFFWLTLNHFTNIRNTDGTRE